MSLKSGICSNCGSHHIYTDTVNPVNDDSNKIALGFSMTGFFSRSNIYTQTYICTDCGLVERYTNDKAALAKIQGCWEPVNTPDFSHL